MLYCKNCSADGERMWSKTVSCGRPPHEAPPHMFALWLCLFLFPTCFLNVVFFNLWASQNEILFKDRKSGMKKGVITKGVSSTEESLESINLSLSSLESLVKRAQTMKCEL